jgi:hypothetical protein
MGRNTRAGSSPAPGTIMVRRAKNYFYNFWLAHIVPSPSTLLRVVRLSVYSERMLGAAGCIQRMASAIEPQVIKANAPRGILLRR